MRDYERRVAAGEEADSPEGAVGGKRPEAVKEKEQNKEVASSSAQGSDTSNSDVPVSHKLIFIVSSECLFTCT